MHFMAVKKTRTRSGFQSNAHFKDSASPAVKGMERSKLRI